MEKKFIIRKKAKASLSEDQYDPSRKIQSCKGIITVLRGDR